MSIQQGLFTAAMLAVIIAAVFLRADDPGNRPFHGDEAVNAVKFDQLWQQGAYQYDPNEFHGPTLPYLTLPVAWAAPADSFAETSEAMFRALPVIFGVALVLLTGFIAWGLGYGPALAAAGLCALSPAMVFYSRYYIHEMPLVVFTFGAILAGWWYARTLRLPWAILCGACLGLMHATKETGAIAAFCMLLALAGTLLLERWAGHASGEAGAHRSGPLRRAGNRLRRVRVAHVIAGLIAGAFVSALFYSSFFTNPQGIVDSVKTYWIWITRGTGEDGQHVHPWLWYLQRVTYFKAAPGLIFTEALIVGLSVVGLIAALAGRALGPASRPLARFLAFYTVLMVLIYSSIPYKTTWSMLSFYHGLILLAGIGAAALVHWVPWRPLRWGLAVVVAAGLLGGGYHLWWQAELLTGRFAANENRNPYLYAQPVRDVRRFAERAGRVAAVHPDGRQMPIRVIDPTNYWPLPFYLRRFPNVGYHRSVPQHPDAAMIIAHPALTDKLNDALQEQYEREYIGLRHGVPPRLVLIRKDLWERFIEAQRQSS